MDLLNLVLTKAIMCILMVEVQTSVDQEDFLNERFIHKFIRPYIHSVQTGTGRQKTTSSVLKRGGATQGLQGLWLKGIQLYIA